MKFKPTNIKGSYDTSPEQQVMRNRVIDILKRNFESYGYLPIETAQLNYLELLTYKYESDAEIVREIYKIRDQGERDLGLRFDLTVPFCKYIAMNQNMKLPFKRYEIGKVFRNGPTKAGRTREFYQCDVDAVGISGAHIEAEMISMAIKVFLELGIKPVVKYGNRKLLMQKIIDAGVQEKNMSSVLGVIDRFDKISREEMQYELQKYMSKGVMEELYVNLSSNQTVDELFNIEDALEDLGVRGFCQFTPSLARGLNIYTGTVWEIYDEAGGITSAIGGGGRYDDIVGNFIDNGLKYPAVGMSFGLEPIMAILGAKKDWGNNANPLVMLVPLGTESWCQKYADTLRKDGKNVLVYLGGKSMAKAFEYAAANGIKQAAVIGEDEVKGKKVTFKEIK